jgi:hypothetical protein
LNHDRLYRVPENKDAAMAPQKLRKILQTTAAILAAALTAAFLWSFFHDRAIENAVRSRGFAHAASSADIIAKDMAEMEQVSHDLAAALSSGRVDTDHIQAEVAKALEHAPATIQRMGVLFRPGSVPGKHLFGPYAERTNDGVSPYLYESLNDYSAKDWFQREPWQTCWNEPDFSHRGGWLMVDYTEPFRLPGAAAPSGVVRLNVTLQGIQAIVDHLEVGNTGYAYLVSAQGIYMAHPVDDLVLSRKSLLDRADSPGKKRQAEIITRKEAGGFTESQSSTTGQKTWVFLKRIPSLGWFVGVVYNKGDLHLVHPQDRMLLALRLTLALGLVLNLLFLGLRGHELGRANLWRAVIAGSVAIVAANWVLFYYVNAESPPQTGSEFQVMDLAGLEKFMTQNATRKVGPDQVKMSFIPTGVFLQTLESVGPGLTRMTGQIWQRLPRETPRDQRGITFPEATVAEAPLGIEKEDGDSIIQFYPFRVVVREERNSADAYPFDRTRVRLRIWPKQFLKPEILVPDLEAYLLPTPKTLPGVDGEIELPGWRVEATEFAFTRESYNTTFGMKVFNGQTDSPELLYNVTLKRKFGTPFIAAFLPILAVAGLLFTLVLTVSQMSERMKATGYSYLNFLRTTIALFFSLVVAQFNIRGRIVADGVINLEWYFFIMYAAILGVSINGLVFAVSDNPVLRYDDNAIAKLAFWPVLLGCFYINSLFFL